MHTLLKLFIFGCFVAVAVHGAGHEGGGDHKDDDHSSHEMKNMSECGMKLKMCLDMLQYMSGREEDGQKIKDCVWSAPCRTEEEMKYMEKVREEIKKAMEKMMKHDHEDKYGNGAVTNFLPSVAILLSCTVLASWL